MYILAPSPPPNKGQPSLPVATSSFLDAVNLRDRIPQNSTPPSTSFPLAVKIIFDIHNAADDAVHKKNHDEGESAPVHRESDAGKL